MKSKKVLSKEYSYTVVYEPIKAGGYQVSVPLLQGLITYGRNFKEAQNMARDAIQCHIIGLMKSRDEIPQELNVLQERVTVSL